MKSKDPTLSEGEAVARTVRARRVRLALPAIIAVVMTVFTAIVGVERLSDLLGVPIEAIAVSIGAVIIGLLGAAAASYLQTGFTQDADLLRSERFWSLHEGSQSELPWQITSKLNALEQRLDAAENRFKRAEVTNNTSPEMLASLTEKVSSIVLNTAPAHIVGKLRTEIAKGADERFNLGESRAIFERGRERMLNEVEALMRRANLNLVGGAITTMAGILLLAYFVAFKEQAPNEPMAFAMHFIPKVTLVIFIQAFAYFFLKLYRTSLEEIKFYQNEITTIEQRYTALASSARSEAAETYAKVIESLASTDRNPTKSSTDKEQLERERTFLQSGVEALKALAPAAGEKA